MVALSGQELVMDIFPLKQSRHLLRLFHQPVFFPAGNPQQLQSLIGPLGIGQSLGNDAFWISQERAEPSYPGEQFEMVQPNG